MRRIGSALVLGLVVAACGGASSTGDDGDRASSSSVAEPMTTTAVTEEPTTTAVTSASATRLYSDGEWVRVAVDEPWVDSVTGIEALPGGGYVAAVTGSSHSAVMWSPDGVEWFQGDPDRDIELPSSDVGTPAPLVVTSDQVVVVDGTDVAARVPLAIGDPRTGVWDRVVLDHTALEGNDTGVSTVNLAAGDDAVLVAAMSAPSEGADVSDVLTWVVDPATGTSESNSFAVDATRESPTDAPLVARVDGRWILIADEDVPERDGSGRRSTLWTSSDGLEWSQTDLPDDMAAIRSLATGQRGVAAVNDGTGAGGVEDAIWYSVDGLEWTKVPYEHAAHPIPVISAGKYGFVTVGEPGLNVFADSSEVYGMFAPFDDEIGGEFDGLSGAGASSGDTLLVLSENESGLWLYSVVTLTPVEWSVSDGGASMIVEARPLDTQDVGGIGASLIWEDTTITLTSGNRIDPRTGLGDGRITIRAAGDGYVHIGDIFGFDERPDMEEAAATRGPPIAACIYVETGVTVHEYCAPLAPVSD
jgi:hypothetical protein